MSVIMGSGRPGGGSTGEVADMHVNRGLLGWGVFLIVLGIVPLAVQAGWLDEDVVRNAWQLWPLILVGIGLGLLLARTPAAVVGNLVVAVTFGLMGGALLATGITGSLTGCGTGVGLGSSGTPFETSTGSFDADAEVDLDFSCGELTIGSQPGGAWSVAGSDPDGREPEITSSGSRLIVRTPEGSGGLNQAGRRWRIGLPVDSRVDLGLSVNAGSAEAVLGGMHVPATNATVNAGSLRLDLSEALDVATVTASANAGSITLALPAASITGSLSATAGSIELCVPDGVGMRFTGTDNPLGSNNFADRGLVESAGTWTSPGYASADYRLEMSASATAGSIALNPESGCD
jgi:hypothetical protein